MKSVKMMLLLALVGVATMANMCSYTNTCSSKTTKTECDAARTGNAGNPCAWTPTAEVAAKCAVATCNGADATKCTAAMGCVFTTTCAPIAAGVTCVAMTNPTAATCTAALGCTFTAAVPAGGTCN